MRISALSIFAAAVLASACGSDAATEPPVIETTTFAPALNVNLGGMFKTASGLYYKDSIVGTGTAAVVNHGITVNYTGWLVNGTKFDSSFDPDRSPFPIPALNTSNVIAGWVDGVAGMKVGGWRKLVIPSVLGYGAGGRPPAIPGNSILVFNVQLVSATP